MMLRCLFLFSFVLILSCKDAGLKGGDLDFGSIPNIEVAKSSLRLDGNEGVWFYNNKPFSGFAVKYHLNNTLSEKTGFLNGKKEGVAKVWFVNGILKLESHYKQNKLVGNYKSWWNNGVLASEVVYVNGRKEGVEKKWYSTGKLSKLRNLVNDKEDGLQQAWLKNGKLYVNYEAKNGRVFGMRRANSCYQLEDEVVVMAKGK